MMNAWADLPGGVRNLFGALSALESDLREDWDGEAAESASGPALSQAHFRGYYDKVAKRGFQFLETNNNANERKDEAS